MRSEIDSGRVQLADLAPAQTLHAAQKALAMPYIFGGQKHSRCHLELVKDREGSGVKVFIAIIEGNHDTVLIRPTRAEETVNGFLKINYSEFASTQNFEMPGKHLGVGASPVVRVTTGLVHPRNAVVHEDADFATARTNPTLKRMKKIESGQPVDSQNAVPLSDARNLGV